MKGEGISAGVDMVESFLQCHRQRLFQGAQPGRRGVMLGTKPAGWAQIRVTLPGLASVGRGHRAIGTRGTWGTRHPPSSGVTACPTGSMGPAPFCVNVKQFGTGEGRGPGQIYPDLSSARSHPYHPDLHMNRPKAYLTRRGQGGLCGGSSSGYEVVKLEPVSDTLRYWAAP